ncbi:MAG: cbb3-type cytochrome c oxidase subunit I [Verrucomicrobiota bacterium]
MGVVKADDSHHDDSHHHELPFWRKYIFSTDHKIIGVQYALASLFFLLLGFILIGLMRWQLAYPGDPIPFVGGLLEAFLGREMADGGVMTAQLYNSFGAMHGTIMVFLAIVPLAFGAFGNYVVPLQIGAPDMCFPRINMASFWVQFVGGFIMVASFFVPGGAAKSGWTSYSPLANIADSGDSYMFLWNGQTMWLLGMVFLITASLLGSVNFIATIIQLRCKGMTWMRLPFFCWAQFITAFLLLLAFPPLEAAGIMQLVDRMLGTSFFLPSGLYVGGEVMDISGGGSPLLWQHLFWFLAHPEVYVLILPAIGIIAEVLTTNTRKPLWGYRLMVGSIFVLGFLSFIVWAHHMYLTNMGAWISAWFQTTTIIISIPSVILISCLLISLWGASMRFPTSMCFATAFLPMFGIGGLTGIPLAFSALDLYLHDTYYVIGHFHYIVAPGTIFALIAGIYHWYPKVTGRHMSEFWGKVHFWPSLIFMNGIFMPMFLQGMAGFHRRWYDGGASYELTDRVIEWTQIFGFEGITYLDLNIVMTWSAGFLFVAQIPFIINFFASIWTGKKAKDNPWNSTTLEWQTPTPPGHGNFTSEPVVDRGPYEYSVPDADEDFLPQGKVS